METIATSLKILVTFIIYSTILLTSPFAILHIIEHWNDPEPMHSGFTPDSPSWHTPNK